MVTGRQAADLLSGVLPTREHARLVLRAGLAGPATRTSSALLYDQDRVVALAARSPVTADEVDVACPTGLYVARLPRTADVDVNAPWREIADAVARQPPMPTLTTALVNAQIRAAGRFPWVATLCGFVVLAAEARGMGDGPGSTIVFDLTEPGVWAEAVRGRLLRTRPGRPWLVREPGRAGLREGGRDGQPRRSTT